MRKRNKNIVVSVVAVFSVILTCLYTVRNNAIRKYDWKVTSGTELKNDFIYFSEGSIYTYSCPLIREKGNIIAIALFQFEGRLIVFSTEEMAFSFLMAI